MDYEKKYKEIVGQLKKAYLYAQTDSTKAVLEEIFPELKESEDERIKEAIIATIHLYYGEPLEDEAKEMLAWLEKQGKQNDSDVKDYNSIDHHFGNPVDFKAKRLYVSKFDGQIHDMTYNPVNGVESKFKVGDWIVENSVNKNPIQITSFEEDKGTGIKVWFNNGTGTYIEFLKGYHKWTIQDIKNGDILAGIYGIFIFIGESNGYCGILSDNTFIRNTGNNEWTEYLHPATKEQRDLLFSKMKNAGYEWDAKKKELIKIRKDDDKLREAIRK
jgi:hypothetical protein